MNPLAEGLRLDLATACPFCGEGLLVAFTPDDQPNAEHGAPHCAWFAELELVDYLESANRRAEAVRNQSLEVPK